MNWRDLSDQRKFWEMIFRRRTTKVQRTYAAVIPWRVWWNYEQ